MTNTQANGYELSDEELGEVSRQHHQGKIELVSMAGTKAGSIAVLRDEDWLYVVEMEGPDWVHGEKYLRD